MTRAAKNSPLKMLPWKTRIALTIISTIRDFALRSDGTVNRALLNFINITTKIPSKPIDGLKIAQITVDPTRNLWFRLYTPINTNTRLPLFLYFHGGGFTYLSPDSKPFDSMCRRFSHENSAIVVSINYRNTPEFKYPSQYEDGFDALKFIDQKKFEGFPANADLSRCFLIGDSAGGNLSHHLAVRVAKTIHEFKELKVIGLIVIQPFFGGEERTESEIRLKNGPMLHLDRTDWYWKVFLPEGSNRDHEACNVFGPNSKDISGINNFPATLVVVGKWDLLQDWQRIYFEGLKRSGKEAYLVEFLDAFHGFYGVPKFPETPLFFKEVKIFVQNQLANVNGE